MAHPFLDRRPGRQVLSRIIEARDLARMINIPVTELQQLGVRMQLPFSASASLHLLRPLV